jgi:NodT family efflux transporter outer membrane factor (OMF) lipoprotein
MNKIISITITIAIVFSTISCKSLHSSTASNENIDKVVTEQTQQYDAWRNVFNDSLLVQLIDTALAHNADLRTASLNVLQAEASLRASRQSLLPTAVIGAEGSFSKANGMSPNTGYNLPVTMQWEWNFGGKHRSEQQSAIADYHNAAEIQKSVFVQLLASIASHYYTLVMMDRQLAVTRLAIENAHHTMEVMQTLKQYGMQNEAAVSQARAEWLRITASEQIILQQIKNTENALSTLVGQRQDSICRTAMDSVSISIDYNRSFPLECLAERPDVKAAEYALMSQVAQVGVARSAFYPSLSITASAGWTNNVGDIINPGKILLNALASIVQPLFSKGQNRANLDIAEARQEQALVAFNQALLVAGTELNDALAACRIGDERLMLRQQEAEASWLAYEVSQVLMNNTSNTYLEVLTAQSAWLQSQLSLASDWLDKVQAQINLFKALGGNY